MKYLLFALILIVSTSFNSFSQKKLLDNRLVLNQTKMVLDATYSMDFKTARQGISDVKAYCPDHPVISFMEALVIYWENFPLYLEHPKAEEFILLMEDCINNSERWEEETNEMEAMFFDLFGRAFLIMFWADNGKSSKVFPHINALYRNTVKGFEMKDRFNEFYFTTGLYNYYIEAYPEKYPAYRPFVIFFKDGDEELGLEQLKYCAENATFLRVEAKLFLSLLYLNYEANIDSAAAFAAQLYNEFPDNPYYTSRYLQILFLNKKYFFVPIVLKHLKEGKGDFSAMQYDLFMATYLEKNDQNYDEAILLYEKAASSSTVFGPFTNQYTAMAYMGLGRIYRIKGDENMAKQYFKEAKAFTSYENILEDR